LGIAFTKLQRQHDRMGAEKRVTEALSALIIKAKPTKDYPVGYFRNKTF